MKIEFKTDAEGLIDFTLTPENDVDKTILAKWKDLNYYTDIYEGRDRKIHIDIQ